MSGVFAGAVSLSTAKLVAGGSGGATPGAQVVRNSGVIDLQQTDFGGAGGDAVFGGNAAQRLDLNGWGGQPAAGGKAATTLGCNVEATAGVALMGGTGGSSSNHEGGGGGGGGIYGGGGGRCQHAGSAEAPRRNGGGGGGSGFAATDVIGADSKRGVNPDVIGINGVGGASGGVDDPFYSEGVGVGGSFATLKSAKAVSRHHTEAAPAPRNGGDGEVVLQWFQPDETPDQPGTPQLPSTGSNTGALVATGTLFIAVGLLLVRRSRGARR